MCFDPSDTDEFPDVGIYPYAQVAVFTFMHSDSRQQDICGVSDILIVCDNLNLSYGLFQSCKKCSNFRSVRSL
eukprot:14100318-Heterocapsa_arctica.AAC.1